MAGVAEVRLIGSMPFNVESSSYNVVSLGWSSINSYWKLFDSLSLGGFEGTLSVTLEVDVIYAKQKGYTINDSQRDGTSFRYLLPYNVTFSANTPIRFS